MSTEEFKKRRIGLIPKSRPTVIPSNEPLNEAIAKIKADKNHILIVYDGGNVNGVVAWSDVFGKAHRSLKESVREANVIVHSPVTIDSNSNVEAAIQKMSDNNLDKLVVVEGPKPVGILTKDDLRSELRRSFKITL